MVPPVPPLKGLVVGDKYPVLLLSTTFMGPVNSVALVLSSSVAHIKELIVGEEYLVLFIKSLPFHNIHALSHTFRPFISESY